MRNKNESSWGMKVAAVLVMGVVVVTGCATPEQSTEEPAAVAAQEEAVDEMVEYLFVQHAEGVALKEGVLTLEGVGDDVLYFSDRPHRVVGRETIEEFLESWDQGDESFAEIPPNAVLTVKQKNELRDLTVVLTDPVLTDRTLVYQVEVLDGPESGTGDFAAAPHIPPHGAANGTPRGPAPGLLRRGPRVRRWPGLRRILGAREGAQGAR
jgi:hypothetical protein